jgi:hypothetical protein
VNGPALVAEGDRVTLVWYTAAGNEPRVYAAQSRDAADTFGGRIRIDEGRTLGRVDAEPLGGGAVAVVWLEGTGGTEAEWRIRRVEADGRLGPPRTVATVTRARLAGFPRLAHSGESVFVAYTAAGPDGGVRVSRLDLTLRPGR